MYILKEHTHTHTHGPIKPSEPTDRLWSCARCTQGNVWASEEGFTHRDKITLLLTINSSGLFLWPRESNIHGFYSSLVLKEVFNCPRTEQGLWTLQVFFFGFQEFVWYNGFTHNFKQEQRRTHTLPTETNMWTCLKNMETQMWNQRNTCSFCRFVASCISAELLKIQFVTTSTCPYDGFYIRHMLSETSRHTHDCIYVHSGNAETKDRQIKAASENKRLLSVHLQMVCSNPR